MSTDYKQAEEMCAYLYVALFIPISGSHSKKIDKERSDGFTVGKYKGGQDQDDRRRYNPKAPTIFGRRRVRDSA